jgi:hypothetical protein
MACGKARLNDYRPTAVQPPMYPDFTDIVIPCNIAPLNFYVENAQSTTLIVEGKKEYRYDSRSSKMFFSMGRWKEMLAAETGDTLHLTVYARTAAGKMKFRSFYWFVSPDRIDTYLSYRLIEPAYEIWNMLQISERNVENFDTRLLGDNNITDHSCMNCHTSNRAPHPTTFMHVRGAKGGTVYCHDGMMSKINTKTSETAGAVYGEISKDGRYGIFTTAEIIPILHSYRTGRLEVYDKASDLILLDFAKGTVTNKPCITGESYQETFPCFSADNRMIYFCRSPHHAQPDSTRQMHYDLYSLSFNPQTGGLGDEVRLVFDAAAIGKSVSFPKCSPDGRYLLFTVSDYGTFPIWHPETDLWMLNLKTGKVDRLPQVNGRYSDSYHSWSTNSRWFVFASKRDDRVYGRPYFAHVSSDGQVSKAFVLPQQDPNSYRNTFKSYNIPELYATPERYDAHAIRKLYYHSTAKDFVYRPPLAATKLRK